MNTYFIASHIFYPKRGLETYGPAHSVYDFLKKHKKIIFFIKHDINGKEKSYVYDKKENVVSEQKPFKNLLVRYFYEVSFNIQSVCLLSQNKKYTYIGIDPINGLAGVIVKFFFHCSKYIYFSVDYSDRRYQNPILNQLYFLADRMAAKLADEAWSVSSRIANVRRKQGILDKKNKILPNSPDFSSIKRIPYNGNLNLILVSNLQDTVFLKPILQAMKTICIKHPQIHLTIVGEGPKEKVLKTTVSKFKLSSTVTFVGQKNHDEVMSYIQKSFLGIAFYLPNGGNKYGDSMKVREYLACGIPVIMNNIPATADDVAFYSAGFVMDEMNTKEVTDFLEKCIKDRKYYEKLRKNALSMGKKFDKEKILQLLLLKR